MDQTETYDVVVIGYGPVGQVCSALLGRRGHKVGVFERHLQLYGQPRAGGLDDEILRTLQSFGVDKAIKDDLLHLTKYGWWNQHGDTLMSFQWDNDGISGWPEHNHFYQPILEEALDATVRTNPSVSIHQGWEAIEITQDHDHVTVTFAQGKLDASGTYIHTGPCKTVRARYVIGADGANSFTRSKVGIALEEHLFREQWLVTDFRPKRPVSYEFDNGQICDPARPHCLFQLGQHHRRWEFMLMPGDDPKEMVKPAKVWDLVSKWLTPDDAELIRSAVYTFRSANAWEWRAGRVFVAGDAAHLMPPYLGQGMCSGIRDVSNLAWKLDLVLRGLADDTLLDSYTLERRPHVGVIIDQSTELGRISCTVDPEVARKRDQAMMSGEIPPAPALPWLTAGIIHGNGAGVAGHLGPQGVVAKGNITGLADDLVGPGWQLITRRGVLDTLDAAGQDVLDLLDVRVLELDTPSGVDDVNGTYGAYLDEAKLKAILVRPDFYVYGGVSGEVSLAKLLADLRRQMAIQI